MSQASPLLVLQVCQLPSNRLVLSDRVYLSPHNLATLQAATPPESSATIPLLVTVCQRPYAADAHPDVPNGRIALNALHRRFASLGISDSVEVRPFFPPPTFALDAVEVSVDTLANYSRRHLPIVPLQSGGIDTDRLVTEVALRLGGQIFEVGRVFAFIHAGERKVALTVADVKGGTVVNGRRMGQLLGPTAITVSRAEGSNLVIRSDNWTNFCYQPLAREVGTWRQRENVTAEAAIWVHYLPKDHIFRLIHREYKPNAVDDNDKMADLRRPVDWDAVLARFGTPECRDWVKTGRSGGRLFLHELCDFDFGNDAERDQIVAVNGPTGLEVLRRAIELYPESVGIPDAEGYYPLHTLCERALYLEGGLAPSIIRLPFRPETRDACSILLSANPEAAAKLVPKHPMILSCKVKDATRSALHLLLGALDNGRLDDKGEEATVNVIERLLELFPRLIEIPDGLFLAVCGSKSYPFDTALGLSRCTSPTKLNLLKKFYCLYPEVASMRLDGRISLHTLLDKSRGEMIVGTYEVVDFLLSADPCLALTEDSRLLEIDPYHSKSLYPAGDALDYACCRCTENMKGIDLFAHGEYIGDPSPYIGGFIAANAAYLSSRPGPGSQICSRSTYDDDESYARKVESFERMFSTLLRLLKGVSDQAYLSPLHAFVNGRQCRPWYLAIMHQILARYPDQIHEVNGHGNLPLHSYLQSCMFEKSRAIKTGYAKDESDYKKAVALCFRLLLENNCDAARKENGDGAFPLILAIQNCNTMEYCDVLEPILELAPLTLFARDIHTGLYPFALASVGTNSNIDTAFCLLRRDPSVLINK